MSSLQLSIKHLNKLKWCCRNVVQRQVFLSVDTNFTFSFVFTFECVVSMLCLKKNNVIRVRNQILLCLVIPGFVGTKMSWKIRVYHQKYLVLSPQTVLEMSQNVIKTSSGFTFMKFQTLKEIGQSELSQRNPCSDSRNSRNCRFSLGK